ncbi:MAG: hypothetical protein N2C12_08385, partial [Planctomycetales bacterium]
NTDLTARLQPTGPGATPTSTTPIDRQQMADWQDSRYPAPGSTAPDISAEHRKLSQFFGPASPISASAPTSNPANDSPDTDSNLSVATEDADTPRAVSVAAMQVLDRYLIAESEGAVVVIDQHALHERILYEDLREKVLSGSLETQKLLVPEPVDLSSSEAAAILDSRELLEQLGVQIEPFGGNTILIASYPAMLANWNPVNLLRSLAEQLTSGGKLPDRRDILDELLHMISCKAAIKAGDRLTPDEIHALVQQRELAQDSHHCPHGRPTSLIFTREELDKQFLRT